MSYSRNLKSVDELQVVVLFTIFFVRLGRLLLLVVDDSSQSSESAEFSVILAFKYIAAVRSFLALKFESA